MRIRKLKKIIFVILILIYLPLKSLARPPLSSNSEEIDPGPENKRIEYHIINHEKVNLLLWHTDYKERCYFSDRENLRTTNIETIEKLLTLIKKEPKVSKYLLSFLKKQNTVICIDERDDETRGYYDFKYNIIGLKEHLELFEKLIILVHELRHITHFNKGYFNSLDYDIDEIIRMNFAIEADVQAIVTLYAWRMKKKDINEVWNAIYGFEHYCDIAEVFEQEIKRSKDEMKATYAAFIQWYKSDWRVDKYYKCSYAWYVDMLDDTKLIQKYVKLPENFFNNLCELPSGKNYGCHRSDEIKKTPLKIIQEAKNYSTEMVSP